MSYKNDMSFIRNFRVVILGSGGVGKSALTCQWIYNVFVESYDPTIEDQYQKIVNIDDNKVQVEVLDTAGTEQFMALHSIYMKSGDAFVLVFSLTSMDTLQELTSLRDQIVRLKEPDLPPGRLPPIVLVGNKADLTKERQVPREIPVALAAHTWSGVPYYETSARNGINVDAIFQDVLRQTLRQRNEIEKEQLEARAMKRKKQFKCTIL